MTHERLYGFNRGALRRFFAALQPTCVSARAIWLATIAVVALLAFYTVSEKPSSSGAVGYQPQAPYTAAFFYPWYPSHWEENGVHPYTNYTPSLGYYSSTDNAVISEQLALAERAHLEVFISSWWEPNEVTDLALQHMLDFTEQSGSPVRWSTYYEREGYSNPSPAQISADLGYLAEKAFSSPAYMRVDGKPVVFAYGEGSDGCATVDRWLEAENLSGIDIYVVLKVFYGYASCENQPDSWHQYSPTSAFDHQLPYSISISPGFAIKGQTAVLKRDIAQFETGVQWMALSGATWQLITTWNEWAEGTAIEPATEYGDTYIDILCRNLPGTTPCDPPLTPVPTPTPTPSPAPPPSVPPTPPATSTPTAAPPVPTVVSLPTPTPTPTPTASPTPQQPTHTAAATPTSEPEPTKKPQSSAHGDVDCNDVVNAVDALAILKRVAGGPPQSGCETSAPAQQADQVYDVDCDGLVRATDGLHVLRFIAGISLPDDGTCPAVGASVD